MQVPLQALLDCTAAMGDYARDARHNVVGKQLDPATTDAAHLGHRQQAQHALRHTTAPHVLKNMALTVYNQRRAIKAEQVRSRVLHRD